MLLLKFLRRGINIIMLYQRYRGMDNLLRAFKMLFKLNLSWLRFGRLVSYNVPSCVAFERCLLLIELESFRDWVTSKRRSNND